MLTKDLLKYRIRQGRVSPQTIDCRDGGLLALAKSMIGVFASAGGMTENELDQKLDEEANSSHKLFPPLKKLLLDRCDNQEIEDDAIVEKRWDCFACAAKLRQGLSQGSYQEFVKAFESASKKPFAQIKDELYADLPAFRPIVGFKTLLPEQLLQRYNVAQAQGLMLRAQSVGIKIGREASIAEKRAFYRAMKFHRLLAEVIGDSSDGDQEIRLSGPLSIFEQSQTYGLRLANFFPHILHLSSFEMEAKVKLKDKNLIYKITHKDRMESTYSKNQSYVPEEYAAVLGKLQSEFVGWEVELGSDVINFGKNSYGIADFQFKNGKGQKIYLEMFHRWHKGVLEQRLRSIEQNPRTDYIMGVTKDLGKDSKISDLLTKSAFFKERGFLTTALPTPKVLKSLLIGQ